MKPAEGFHPKTARHEIQLRSLRQPGPTSAFSTPLLSFKMAARHRFDHSDFISSTHKLCITKTESKHGRNGRSSSKEDRFVLRWHLAIRCQWEAQPAIQHYTYCETYCESRSGQRRWQVLAADSLLRLWCGIWQLNSIRIQTSRSHWGWLSGQRARSLQLCGQQLLAWR